MYINLAKTKNLERGDVELLVAIKQVETTYLIEHLSDSILERLESLSLISRVKPKKKGEHPYTCLRLSDKAKKLLIEMSFEGAADEESEKITSWLINIYKNKEGGIVKNKTETLRRIHWFKTVTEIKKNRLAILLKCFMEDTYDSESGESVKDFMNNNPRGVLSNMLDNVCWSPPNMMARHYTLADSPLYKYWEDNEEYVKLAYKEQTNNDW